MSGWKKVKVKREVKKYDIAGIGLISFMTFVVYTCLPLLTFIEFGKMGFTYYVIIAYALLLSFLAEVLQEYETEYEDIEIKENENKESDEE